MSTMVSPTSSVHNTDFNTLTKSSLKPKLGLLQLECMAVHLMSQLEEQVTHLSSALGESLLQLWVHITPSKTGKRVTKKF